MKHGVIVGCGGLAFHSLGTLSVIMSMLEIDRLFTVDHDSLEAKNLARQPWGEVGTSKAVAAREVLAIQCPDVEVIANQERAQDFDRWHALGEQALVICFPDNHAARMYTIDAATAHAGNAPITLLFGGNEPTFGNIVLAHGLGKDLSALLKAMHPEMWDTSQADHDPERPACSAVPAQSLVTNILTASCVASAWSEWARSPEWKDHQKPFLVEYAWQRKEPEKDSKTHLDSQPVCLSRVACFGAKTWKEDLKVLANPPKPDKKD